MSNDIIPLGGSVCDASISAPLEKIYGATKPYELECGVYHKFAEHGVNSYYRYYCRPLKEKHPYFRIILRKSDPISLNEPVPIPLRYQPYYPALCVSLNGIRRKTFRTRFGQRCAYDCYPGVNNIRPVDTITNQHIMNLNTVIQFCIAYTQNENGQVDQMMHYTADMGEYLAWIHTLCMFQRRIRSLLSLTSERKYTIKQTHLIPLHIPSDVAGVVTQYVSLFPNCRHICIPLIK